MGPLAALRAAAQSSTEIAGSLRRCLYAPRPARHARPRVAPPRWPDHPGRPEPEEPSRVSPVPVELSVRPFSRLGPRRCQPSAQASAARPGVLRVARRAAISTTRANEATSGGPVRLCASMAFAPFVELMAIRKDSRATSAESGCCVSQAPRTSMIRLPTAAECLGSSTP